MESIGMTSRTSQMRTTKAHLCTFFILLFMFFAASAQTAMAQETKVTPKVSFTQSEEQKTAIVGQIKYERPTLTVEDAKGNSISRYFSQSWSFVDENDKEKEIGVEGKDALNRPIYTDPVTGSTIIKSYGGLTIGKKYGKVTIKVTLTPTPAYADKYNSASATFSIDVQKPTVTAEYYNGTTLLNSNKEGTTSKALQFYRFKKDDWNYDFTSNGVPTAKLYYTSEADNNTYDISSYYDYTYAPPVGIR
jgi:hypothetical protein